MPDKLVVLIVHEPLTWRPSGPHPERTVHQVRIVGKAHPGRKTPTFVVHSWELLDGLVAPTARTERPEFLRAVTAGIMREAGVEKVTGLEWNNLSTEGGR